MASRHKANVLRAYRELVAVVRGMPAAERDAQLQESRAAIRANAGEADPGKASDQLTLLGARLSWLQVVRVCWHSRSPWPGCDAYRARCLR